jgi:Family of unknown function (DUF6350)
MPTLQSVSYGAVAARSGVERGGRGRTLLVASVGPLVIGYLGIAALLALVTATAPGADVSTSGVLAAAGPAWLAAYHVPVVIEGSELGVLPLLPTALMVLLVARTAGNAARRLDLHRPRSSVRVIASVGFAHALFGAALALLCSNGTVAASAVVAFFVAGILGAIAAAIGTARPCGLPDAVLDRADVATEAGLRAGGYAVIGLVGVGGAVYALGMLASWSTSAELFHATASGIGSGLGMVLLCIAYLPNALIGTLSFAAGPGFTIGHVSVAQWSFQAGPVPALPLLAPLPAVAGHWWIFLMLLPAGVGVLVGLACRGFVEQRGARLRAVLMAALVAGVSWLVLAALAGGALAGGPFDPVTVPAGLLAVSVFLFVAVFGLTTVGLVGRTGGWLATDDDEYLAANEEPTDPDDPDETDDPDDCDSAESDEADHDDLDEPESEGDLGEVRVEDEEPDEPDEPDVSEFESEFDIDLGMADLDAEPDTRHE